MELDEKVIGGEKDDIKTNIFMTCVDNIDVGLDLFLELNGSTYWCGESEIQAAKQYAKDVVEEVREDLAMGI